MVKIMKIFQIEDRDGEHRDSEDFVNHDEEVIDDHNDHWRDQNILNAVSEHQKLDEKFISHFPLESVQL